MWLWDVLHTALTYAAILTGSPFFVFYFNVLTFSLLVKEKDDCKGTGSSKKNRCSLTFSPTINIPCALSFLIRSSSSLGSPTL